jgi:hypothetical protein
MQINAQPKIMQKQLLPSRRGQMAMSHGQSGVRPENQTGVLGVAESLDACHAYCERGEWCSGDRRAR